MDDLDELLARFDAVENVFAAGLFADILQELFDDLVVYICFQKRQTHFLQHIFHIRIGQRAFAGHVPHCMVQSFA